MVFNLKEEIKQSLENLFNVFVCHISDVIDFNTIYIPNM